MLDTGAQRLEFGHRLLKAVRERIIAVELALQGVPPRIVEGEGTLRLAVGRGIDEGAGLFQLLFESADRVVCQVILHGFLGSAQVGAGFLQRLVEIRTRRLGIDRVDGGHALRGPGIGQPGRHVRLPMDGAHIDNIRYPPHGNSGPQVVRGEGGQGPPGGVGGGGDAVLDLGGDGRGGQ